nr:zinc finger, BED-type, phospholipase-like, homeodomain-like protein [Tanacetum cinerariifolium]
MTTQSTSTSVSVGSSNEPTIVEVIETTRNKDIWQHYDLCKMSDESKKGRCKQCDGNVVETKGRSLEDIERELSPEVKEIATFALTLNCWKFGMVLKKMEMKEEYDNGGGKVNEIEEEDVG